MANQFAWSFGGFDGRADPDVCAAEIETVRIAGGGRIEPAAVVAFAEDPQTELHKLFEWDDAEAARRQRLDMARKVVRSLRIIVHRGEREEVRRFYINVKDNGQRGYVQLGQIRTESAKHALMKQASRDLRAWTERYRDLSNHAPDALRHVQFAVNELQDVLDDELQGPFEVAAE